MIKPSRYVLVSRKFIVFQSNKTINYYLISIMHVIVLIYIITIVLYNIWCCYIHYYFEMNKAKFSIDQTALTRNKPADVKKYIENVITLRFDRNLLYHGVIFINVKLFIWDCQNNAICLIIGGINQLSGVIIAFDEIRP